MWARIKGRTENAILGLGFRDAVVLRPGVIVPRRGVRHSIRLYGWMAAAARPLLPILRALGVATSTAEIGRAMIAAALGERLDYPPRQRLRSKDINDLAARLDIDRFDRSPEL